PTTSHVHLATFLFNETAPSNINTLSLHDALPIYQVGGLGGRVHNPPNARQRRPALPQRPDHCLQRAHHQILRCRQVFGREEPARDRKSTRLNSSHSQISYAVFCLKKKNKRKDGKS